MKKKSEPFIKRALAFLMALLLTFTTGVTDLLGSISGTVTAQAAEINGSTILTEALKMLGTPYVWGGQTASSVDCSGLVYYILTQKMGITNVPRDTATWNTRVHSGLTLKDSNGNTVPVQVNVYDSGSYLSAALEPGTIILQNGHMSIYVGEFAGVNNGSLSNFRLDTLYSVKNQMVSQYGSAVSGLASKLHVAGYDAGGENNNFYMDGRAGGDNPSAYNKYWRVEAVGNSSNTASNPGRGVSLTNSKFDKNGAVGIVATITLVSKGKIRFTKTGQNTKDAVKDATYAVYPSSMSDSDVQKRPSSGRVTTFKTNASGQADVSLDAGTYKAIEITAPSGFELSDKVYTVKCSTGSTTNQAVEDKEKPVTLRLKKTDAATGKSLTGATFKLFYRRDKDGTTPKSDWKETTNYYWEPVSTMKYNSSTGYYEAADVYPDSKCGGNIRIYETAAPDGYDLDSTWYWEVKVLPAAASYSGSLQRVNYGTTGTYSDTVTNEPKTVTMRLQKVDEATGHALTGAEFTVYERITKEGTTKQSTWKETTNYYWKPVKKMSYSGGYYTASGLKADTSNEGHFCVWETKAPTGYELNTSFHWEIYAADKNASYNGSLTRVNYGETATYSDTVKDTPKPISITLKKTDAVTGAALAGAEFTVYESLAKDGVTRQSGWLETAGFYWKPVKTMTYDSSRKLYKAELQATASNNGYFKVKETKAPEGFELNSDWSWDVRSYDGDAHVTDSGTQYIAPGTTGAYGQFDDSIKGVSNTPKPFYISIDKRDGDTKAVLKNVEFTIYSRMSKTYASAHGIQQGSDWLETTDNLFYPYGKLAFNEATQKYDTVILANGQKGALVADEANQGYFRIYETKTENASYLPYEGYWYVRGTYDESKWMETSGIQYIKYGTTGVFGQYTDSPYMENFTDNTSLTIRKVWNDTNNRDGIRPDSVQITLKATHADGTPVTEKEMAELTGTADSTNGSTLKKAARLAVPADGDALELIGETIENTADETVTESEDGAETADETVVETPETTEAPAETSVQAQAEGMSFHVQAAPAVQNVQPVQADGMVFKSSAAPAVMMTAFRNDTVIEEAPVSEAPVVTEEETIVESFEEGTSIGEASVMTEEETVVESSREDASVGEPPVITEEETIVDVVESSEEEASIGEAPVMSEEETVVESFEEEASIGEPPLMTGEETTVESESETETETEAETEATVVKRAALKAAAVKAAAADSDAAYAYTVTLNAANNWKASVKNLPMRSEKGVIKYSIVEESVPAGYTVSYKTSGTTLTATNTHTPETVTIPVRKVWNDKSNTDNIRPKEVTVRLYADGAEINSATLDSSTSWKYTFTTDKDGNDLYKNKDGKAVSYTIKEDAVEGYTVTGSAWNAAGDLYTITNTHIPHTEIDVEKVWSDYNNAAGKRPESITVHLYADGTEVNAVQITAKDGWKYTFTTDSKGELLEKYSSGNTLIEYTIKEDTPAGYNTPKVTGSADAGFTITNTYKEYTEASAVKVWKDYQNAAGIRPDSVTVVLYADDKAVNTAILSDTNGWTCTFTTNSNGKKLEKYKADGTAISYDIREESVAEGYTSTTKFVSGTGFVITNTHKDYVEVPVEKTWNDYSNAAGKRPESITVRLYADGTEVNTVQITAKDEWKYTFTKDAKGNRLESYTEDGKDIRYTITEDRVEGYSSDIDEVSAKQSDGSDVTGFVIKNTFRAYVSIPVKKTWSDGNNRDGIRPESVTVHLLADGKEVNSAVLSDANSWNVTFETNSSKAKLQKYSSAGKLIQYTVTEDTVTGYTAAVTGDQESGYTVRNSHTPETTKITVNKFWNDKDAKARPESITVHLFADGTEINTATVTAETEWKYTFTKDGEGKNLYRFRDGGTEIVYSVKEDVPAGWLASIKGFDITNTPTVLTVSKQDVTTGAEVPGATLEIYAADKDGKAAGKALYSWVSTDKPHVVTAIPAGTYVLRETLAPEADGYIKASDVVFTIENDGKVQGVIMKDDYTKVQISKTDITTGKEIKGASLKITDKSGKTVAEWTTDGKVHQIDRLGVGTYTLTETSAPAGYVVAESVKFTVKATGEIQKVEMKDDFTKVQISKTDITTGEEIEGAELKITDKDGNTVAEWITDGTPYEIDRIPAGTYTLTETTAPDGYVVAESVTFTVEATGEIQMVEMKDDYTKVQFKKTDITTGKEIPGAKLKITDKDGNTVAEWTTDGTPYEIDRIPAGTYTLTETTAPDGYTLTESIEFTVEATGEIQTVEMKDDYTKIQFKKTDITTGEEIEGANLKITDKDGNTVAEWTTDGTPYEIDRIPAGTYTLTETTAPDGYVVAESVEFTVKATGEIQMVEMKDDFTKVQIKKTDITTGKEIEGAELKITDKDGKTIAEWTTDGTPYEIDRIPAGTYTLTETTAPDGYTLTESIEFTVEATGEIQTVEMKDDYTKIQFKKTDITTGEEIEGANLKITDKDGNTVAEWTTDGTPYEIDRIPAGTYTLTETTAPDGYVVAESVEFTVYSTGEIQMVEMKDDFTKVQIKKADITTGKEIPGAKLKITDKDGNTVAEWTTDGTPYEIDRIPAGIYTLTETTAPEGYVVAESVEFTVEATGEIQMVEMKDDYTKVEISKTDFVNGKELTGAKLVLKDASGKKVAEWTTDGTPHRIDYLVPGTYTLTEISAPDGYELAESVTFTVNATGEIQKVEMKDKPVVETPPTTPETPKTPGTPETPILGIEDHTTGLAVFMLALSGLFTAGGVVTYRRKKQNKA